MPESKQNFYFPLAKGQYQVTAGLHILGTDFGNGISDSHVFQFDENFNHYRETKVAARTEALEKYYCKERLDSQKQATINKFIIQQLCQESPDKFLYQKQKDQHQLQCKLTDELLVFDPQYQLAETQPGSLGYVDGLDALAMQVQEDLSLVTRANNGNDRIVSLHLCFPNHWAAEEKIGKSFLASHAPVPGMAKINQRAEQLFNSLINKGPFVRFAWGMATDKQLNHHPIAPEGVDDKLWQGRSFNPVAPQLFLRVERQVIHGFPPIAMFMFTIRTYFYDVAVLKQDSIKREALQSALQSMSPATLRYKGLADSLPLILDWLEN